ncbi:MAG: DUF4157 domain-containing protein [Pseudomonadota bacterium]
MREFASKQKPAGQRQGVSATRRAGLARHLDAGPGDRDEQEAYRVAERVLAMPASALPKAGVGSQRATASATAPATGSLTAPATGSATASATASDTAPGAPQPLAGGHAMDPQTAAFMESRFQHDFSRVSIHTDTQAAGSAQALQARAYTAGNHIVFNAGMYEPGTAGGKRLLAHELTHVIQQQSRARPMIQRQGLYPPIPIMLSRPCRRRVPNGSANPNTGVTVAWHGNQIDIVARVQFSGPAASAQVAQAMRQDIERVWNATFADGYGSTCRLDVVTGGATDATRAQIVVGTGGSVDQSSVRGATMYFMYSGSPADLVWSPSHEFAHLLGLDDRRTTPWWDFLGTQPETSEPGYERNIMGAMPGGDIARRGELLLESRNIRDWLNRYAMEIGNCAADMTA